VSIPGPRTAALARRLRARESRNVTFIAEDFPIFWESARGATVVDVDGNEYIDCTAAFGVANAGHGNPRVAQALHDQARLLMHGMGDVHPTEVRVQLLERLADILPCELTTTFLATTGSEAIEAALKTAVLITGKSRFAAYRGGYHGLSLGALGAGGIERFRAPFAAVLGPAPVILEFPHAEEGAVQAAARTREALAGHDDVAALVIEPIQGRAGCIVPPDGYLRELRAICDERNVVMIVDELFTGFGRTGEWFAVDRERIVPDILCIGKAMGSGVPISAAVGRARIMDAWPASTGEALHTSTFLGNPLGCAAALATIDELQRHELPARAKRLGAGLASRLGELRAHRRVVEVRGRGLLWGVQLVNAAVASQVVKRALTRGVMLLQSGIAGDTISITPPLVIEESQLAEAIETLQQIVGESA